MNEEKRKILNIFDHKVPLKNIFNQQKQEKITRLIIIKKIKEASINNESRR